MPSVLPLSIDPYYHKYAHCTNMLFTYFMDLYSIFISYMTTSLILNPSLPK